MNIEREAKLSGSTHDKGVLILSGYLGNTFARDFPLSVTVSVAFEQSYGGIDGDSASSTELYAILSNLSELPIKQGIAVSAPVVPGRSQHASPIPFLPLHPPRHTLAQRQLR